MLGSINFGVSLFQNHSEQLSRTQIKRLEELSVFGFEVWKMEFFMERKEEKIITHGHAFLYVHKNIHFPFPLFPFHKTKFLFLTSIGVLESNQIHTSGKRAHNPKFQCAFTIFITQNWQPEYSTK